ncbi:type II secretion system F family protein [Candidatus Dependentiae bacterium]
MPYYYWRGVNIFGDMKKGKAFARSVNDLDKTLFSRNIAIISCKNSKIRRFFNKISQDNIIHFFRQLAILLDAGVRLPDALMILCNQARNMRLKQVIFLLELDVLEGFSLSKALSKQAQLFDAMIIQIVQVGQESGNLGACLHQLSDYLQERRAFYKKIKSAAILPLITLAFFFMVTFAIFAFVVPKFADVFASIGKDLPPLTKTILRVSEFLRSNLFLFALVFTGSLLVLTKKYLVYFKCTKIKRAIDKACINLPFLGEIYRNSFLVHFLRSISMLLKSGVRLVPAIYIAKSSIKNSVIKSQVCKLEQDVYAGSSLSQSMVDYGDILFPQDLVSVVKVGEETGQLHVMLDKAADMYWQKISRSILFFTTIFQPLLMIMLGLLITLLIFAIYVPIFGLASLV